MSGLNWMQQVRYPNGRDSAPTMTQQELASRLGSIDPEGRWDQSRVSRIEANPDDAPMRAVIAMLRALGVDNPMAFLMDQSQDTQDGVDAGVPLAGLHRDIAMLKNYVQLRDWRSPDPEVEVPDIDLLTELCDRLARKPDVAFFGKFDVGKSTLVNTVLGRPDLPTSYQPATRVVTFVRHLEDRPVWLQEQVLMLDKDFDTKKWADESHCQTHKVVAGGLETLHSHGTHKGNEALGGSEAHYALVYVDAPVLRSCTIIDLPGTENDTLDSEKAKASEVAYDVAVFADTVQGFLSEGSLLRLGEVVRNLPAFEGLAQGVRPLSNLFVVATHAHRDISDQQLAEEVLSGGRDRAWRQLGESALASRGEVSGVTVSRDDLDSRFFPFYKEIPSRRDPFLSSLESLLAGELPLVLAAQASQDTRRFQTEAVNQLQGTIEFYNQTIDSREHVKEELAELLKQEPQRKKVAKYARSAVESAIAKNKAEMSSDIHKYVTKNAGPDAIQALIEKNFSSKKDAQQNAAALVLERIQHHVEKDVRKRTEKVSDLINEFVGEYEQATMATQSMGTIKVPFNAKGAFAGGIAGLAAVGGLALWASTLGNLGAYILVTQAVSAVSALGIATGGTAVWVSAVAAIGGPITIAIGIVVIAGILGWGLLRGSWEGRLAKKIAAELRKANIEAKYEAGLNQYWDDTAKAFEEGADSTEREWKRHLNSLRRLVEETDLEALKTRLDRLEELRGFFLELPCTTLSSGGLSLAG